MGHDDLCLSPKVEDTRSLLTLEKRITELKQECEDLVGHSKRLQRDRQQLGEHFDAGMQHSLALQMDLDRQLLNLKAKLEALRERENDLQEFLSDHRFGRG